MEFADLRNESGLEFTDISSESWRAYEFPGGNQVAITEPIALHVSESGGHRICDAGGQCHYIPATWIHLWWCCKIDAPHFVK